MRNILKTNLKLILFFYLILSFLLNQSYKKKYLLDLLLMGFLDFFFYVKSICLNVKIYLFFQLFK